MLQKPTEVERLGDELAAKSETPLCHRHIARLLVTDQVILFFHVEI